MVWNLRVGLSALCWSLVLVSPALFRLQLFPSNCFLPPSNCSFSLPQPWFLTHPHECPQAPSLVLTGLLHVLCRPASTQALRYCKALEIVLRKTKMNSTWPGHEERIFEPGIEICVKSFLDKNTGRAFQKKQRLNVCFP